MYYLMLLRGGQRDDQSVDGAKQGVEGIGNRTRAMASEKKDAVRSEELIGAKWEVAVENGLKRLAVRSVRVEFPCGNWHQFAGL